MSVLAKGTTVTIVGSTLTGTVSSYRVSDDGSKIEYLVDYADLQGIPQQRGFEEHQIVQKQGD